MSDLPIISIVTPSYNQAEYLEETIQSVVGQHYPRLEYIIMDGGSTDGSVDVIQRHKKSLTYWVSQRDGGMYDAVNTGMSHATGDILAWINSDDFYFPGTFAFVARQMDPAEPQLLFGNAFHFVQGTPQNWGTDVERAARRKILNHFDYIVQPSAFWTRAAWLKTGALDATFQYSGDWEWLLRAKRAGVRFQATPRYLSAFRIYPENKTISGREKRWRELRIILERNAEPNFVATFDRVLKHRDALLRVRRATRRMRLARLDPIIFRLAFPRVFAFYPTREIWDMIETIGYS